MSAAEGNGLGAERLAELREAAGAATPGPWKFDGHWWLEGVNHAVVEDAEAGEVAFTNDEDAEHIAAFDPPTVLALLDAIDRLTRERDEAREVVGRVRGLMSAAQRRAEESPSRDFQGRPFYLGPPFEALRAALSDDRASGRDQAARPSSTPKRPSEHLTSADEGPHFDDAAWIREHLEPARSVEWTFDSPAVRPSDDEGELA